MLDRRPRLTLVDLDGRSSELEVLYKFTSESVEQAFTHLRAISQTLAAAAAKGAFPGSDHARSHLEMNAETVRSADEIAHHFLSVNLEARAFQCLRNMARRLRRDGVVVSHIVVTGAGRRGDRVVEVPWPTDANEGEAYPDAHPSVKAILDWEDSEFAKSRRCLMEASQPLESDSVVAFERSVEPWYHLVESGGYATPVGLPEELESIAGSVNQFDEHTVEVGIDRLSASERVWVPLANVAHAFWGLSGGLRRIIVD